MVNQSKVNDPRFWKSGAVGTIDDAMALEDKQKMTLSDRPLVLGIDTRTLTELRPTGSFSIETFHYDGKTENGYNPDGYLVARYTSPDGRIIVQGNGSSHHWYAMESMRYAIESCERSGIKFPRRTA